MSLRIANGPVSWGVDFADAPGIPTWETVFSEIGEAGYQWCELGPLGYLPDDDVRVRAELDARGLGVAGSYVFEPMEDRARLDEICDTARRTSERIAALGGSYRWSSIWSATNAPPPRDALTRRPACATMRTATCSTGFAPFPASRWITS